MLKRSARLLLAWLLALFAWSASIGEIGLANAQDCRPDSAVARAVEPIAQIASTKAVAKVAKLDGVGRIRCSPTAPPSALAEHQLEGLGGKTGYLPIAFIPEDGSKSEIVATWLAGKKIVDEEGRVYDDWSGFLRQNDLDPGKIVYPYGGDPASCPGRFDSSYTPAKRLGNRVAVITDGLTTIGSVVTMVAAFFGASGYAWAAAGAIMTGWGLYRSAQVLVDRWRHKQTLDPRVSPSARSAILSAAAAIFGFGASGAEVSAAFAGMAEQLGGLSTALTVINALDGLAHLFQHWREYSSDERLKMLFSIAGGGDDTRADAPDELPPGPLPPLVPAMSAPL